MLMYVAMPIDRSKKYETLYKLLVEMADRDLPEHVLYFPGRAFSGYPITQHNMDAMIKANYAVLDISDVVLVIYRPGVESWGVPQEVAYAHDNDKQLYLVELLQGTEPIDWYSLPLYLRAYVDKPYVMPWKSFVAETNLMIEEEL